MLLFLQVTLLQLPGPCSCVLNLKRDLLLFRDFVRVGKESLRLLEQRCHVARWLPLHVT